MRLDLFAKLLCVAAFAAIIHPLMAEAEGSVPATAELVKAESNLLDQLEKLKGAHTTSPETVSEASTPISHADVGVPAAATADSATSAELAGAGAAVIEAAVATPEPVVETHAMTAEEAVAKAQSIYDAAKAEVERLDNDYSATAADKEAAKALEVRAESALKRAQALVTQREEAARTHETRVLEEKRAAERAAAQQDLSDELERVLAEVQRLNLQARAEAERATAKAEAIKKQQEEERAKEAAAEAKEKELKEKYEQEIAEREKEKQEAVQQAVEQVRAEEQAKAAEEIQKMKIHDADAKAALDEVSVMILKEGFRPPADSLGGEIYDLSLLMQGVYEDQRQIGEQLLTHAGLAQHLLRAIHSSEFLGSPDQKQNLFGYIFEVTRILNEAVILHDELRAALSNLLVDDSEGARNRLNTLHRMTEFTLRKLYAINENVQVIVDALHATQDGEVALTKGLFFDELVRINRESHSFAVREGLAKADEEPKIVEVAAEDMEGVLDAYARKTEELRTPFIGDKVDLVNDIDKPMQPKMAAAMLLSLNKELAALWDRNARQVEAAANLIGASNAKIPHDKSPFGLLAEFGEKVANRGDYDADESNRLTEVIAKIRSAKPGFSS